MHVDHLNGTSIDNLKLLPTISWHKKLEPYWKIGELSQLIKDKGLSQYKDGRNLPSKPYVSRLSAHLHFGEISPNQLWYDVKSLGDD